MKNTKSSTRMPWLVKLLLNPGTNCYRQCTEATKNNFVSLSQVFLFTVTLCGIILGLSLSKFGFQNNTESKIILFPIACGFYYFLDRFVIMSDASQNKKLIRRLRIFIAVIFGLLNSFLIDSFWFAEDIKALRETEIVVKQKAVDNRYDSTIQVMVDRKYGLLGQVDSATKKLSSWQDTLMAEVNAKSSSHKIGRGPQWQTKLEAFQKDSAWLTEAKNQKLSEVSAFDSSIAALNVLRLSESQKIPAQVSQGINHSMELLHQAIFASGKPTNLLVAFLLLIIAMIAELLPLIGKAFYNIQEYFDHVINEREASMQNSNIRKQNAISSEAQRLIHENQRNMSNEFADHIIQTMQDEFENSETMIHRTEEHLQSLEEKQKHMKKKWPHFYDEYISPLFDKVYRMFKKSSDQSFSKQSKYN